MITWAILCRVGLRRPITGQLVYAGGQTHGDHSLLMTVIIETTGGLLSRCLAKVPLADKVYIVLEGYTYFINSISLYSDNLFEVIPC